MRSHLSKSKEDTGHSITRRRFIGRAGAVAAMVHLVPNYLRGQTPPSKRVNVAGIGIGSQGGSDINAVGREGHQIVALCDVDDQYAAKQFAKYPEAKRFKDYRVMLDKMGRDLDAVVIGTPDHTHAIIAMEAMRRGKHVYCEKPLAHSIHEVDRLIKAARQHKVVTQLGNQGHSSDTIRNFCEWIWDGAIGDVHEVHAFCGAFKDVYCQINKLDQLNESHDIPKGLDYDR